MPSPFTFIDGYRLSTYTLLLTLGCIAGAFLITWRLRTLRSPAHIVDVCLAGLIAAIPVARLEHVALHWNYFSAHQKEITRLAAGGLSWHGAVIGALIGITLMATARRIPLRPLFDALALAFPVIAFAAAWGCGAAACAYGAEVVNLADWSPLVVWEGRDIYGLTRPRFSTQALMMALAVAVLLINFVLTWRGWLRGRRLGLTLVLFSFGMLLIGFLRGDTVMIVGALRADQWLDAVFIAFGSALIWVRKR